MSNPMFPVPLTALQARLDFQDFKAGEAFDLAADVHVRTAPLVHPNGATAYRVEHAGQSFCYVTDTEHTPGQPNQAIIELIRDADCVVYDCTYTDDEFPKKVGWGHSTWQEGMRLCRAANVKQFVIFHHDPDHDDAFMARLEAEAKATWDRTIVARDNMVLDLA
jgi:phosphoribosyl 1,2-cyclic phosphodiesterase